MIFIIGSNRFIDYVFHFVEEYVRHKALKPLGDQLKSKYYTEAYNL